MKNIKLLPFIIPFLFLLSYNSICYSEILKDIKWNIPVEKRYNLQTCFSACKLAVAQKEKKGEIPKMKATLGKLSPYHNQCYRSCICSSKRIRSGRPKVNKMCKRDNVKTFEKSKCIWWNPLTWWNCIKSLF